MNNLQEQTGKYLLKLIVILLTWFLVFVGQISSASETESVDFVEIYKMAGFAQVVYQTEEKAQRYLNSRNYTLDLFETDPDVRVTFFLATNDANRSQIISVRGTSNTENAMVDIMLKLRVDQKTGLRLHEGFALAARQVYSSLKPYLQDGYQIDTTGHSLGGAIAFILATYLDQEKFDVGQVVTFGQPKVTNVVGAEKMGHLDVTRIVTPRDVVPLVPPLDPLDINNIDIYWHVGREVILLDGDQYSVTGGLDSMLRATKFTQQVPSEEDIRNHSMSAYLALTSAKIKSSKKVPYQNSLNLFNLFGTE